MSIFHSSNRPAWADYLLMTVGALIIAVSVKNIFDPANMVIGGASGLAIIIKAKFGVPLWLTNTLFNIPLFLGALKIKGWKFIKRTVFATVALSLWLYVIPNIPFVADDLLLVALYGGLVCGAGTGLVLLAVATTGGTDTLAALIQPLAPHYSIAQIMLVLDSLIVLAGLSTFGLHLALYAMIAIFVLTKISDGIIEGLKFSKSIYIISDHAEAIAQAIMTELSRGVTGLSVKGMYSGEPRQMLYCVVSKKEITQIKEIVAGFDRKAFVIVEDAREVLGEGFIEY
ncbi:MAG: YitT family protein [Lachnospiraceae bacterium]|nr:YitT family protein [Lachnospiraceae bacterium]MDE6929188.1 YitT family protein [Lachnospiraceae bacterium]